jgi:hypothetical protein
MTKETQKVHNYSIPSSFFITFNHYISGLTVINTTLLNRLTGLTFDN